MKAAWQNVQGPVRVGAWIAWLWVAVAGGHRTEAAEPGWWSRDWPYRARIECAAGQGDVAQVKLTLAGRTTPDGRELRLLDEAKGFQPFEILHHDPKLATLLQIRVPPDKPGKLWLYFGNTKAPAIETNKILFGTPSQRAQTVAQWKKNQAGRAAALQRQQGVQKQLDGLRRRLATAREAGTATRPANVKLPERIEELEKQLASIRIPPEVAKPPDPRHWYPSRGVLLRIYRKTKPMHPKSLKALRSLISQSLIEGAGFQSGISNGYNPFGSSDHYISVYDGYLRIDEAGEYRFCSASDAGSWVTVKNRPLVEWPGPHGWGGSERGQKNGAITLSPGVVHVRYYHEEGDGGQMAFMGWKPPGAEGFGGIPKTQWLPVRQAIAAAYESASKPVMAVPSVSVVNTAWVPETEAEQATLVRFLDRSRSTAGKIANVRWSFGDGLSGAGQDLQHVYFRVYRPEVKLTVSDAKGNEDAVACSPNIFKVDVRAPAFQFSKAENYEKIAAGYDVRQMNQADLGPCAVFWGKVENWPQHVRAADAFIGRFPTDEAVRGLAVTGAGAYLQPACYDPKRANELIDLAIGRTKDAGARRDLELRRAGMLAWELEDYRQAQSVFAKWYDSVKDKKDKTSKALARRCLIGLGDVALLSAQYAEAEALYRGAEAIAPRKIESPEELAKRGGYPYTVEDFLERDEYQWALNTVDEWEEQFPVQKLEGLTFFLRGKVLYVQKPGLQSLRYLKLAERVSPRAVHVPEAVWLRAHCLMAADETAQALAEFQRIRADFTQSEFFSRAPDKIRQCQDKLKGAAKSAADAKKE